MKKYFLSLVISLVFVLSFAYADNIGYVDAKFCNDGKKIDDLNVIVNDQREENVCIEFTNSSAYDLAVDLGFVDAVVTNDANNNRACDSSTDFAKFIINPINSITLSGNSSTTKYFNFKFPVEFDGFAYGCLVYNLNNKDVINVDNQMFDILVLKAKFMSFYVGETDIDDSIEFIDFWKKVDDNNDLIVGFTVKNNGDLSQTVNVSGFIENIFGYHREFGKSFDIAPGQTIDYNINDNKIRVPDYRGYYKVDFDIDHKPQLLFDLRKKYEKVYVGGEYVKSLYIFLWSWQITVGVVVFAIFMLLVYLAFFRPNKLKKI